MEKYWEKVRSEALDSMRRLTGQDVEDNCEDMERALEFVLKHGKAKDISKAISDFDDFKWAIHEIAAHEAK